MLSQSIRFICFMTGRFNHDLNSINESSEWITNEAGLRIDQLDWGRSTVHAEVPIDFIKHDSQSSKNWMLKIGNKLNQNQTENGGDSIGDCISHVFKRHNKRIKLVAARDWIDLNRLESIWIDLNWLKRQERNKEMGKNRLHSLWMVHRCNRLVLFTASRNYW